MDGAFEAFLGKAGKALFEKHLQQYAPQDPLYETYTDKKGKQKRRKVCIIATHCMDIHNNILSVSVKSLLGCPNEMQKSSNL
jgi:hypothetical protein